MIVTTLFISTKYHQKIPTSSEVGWFKYVTMQKHALNVYTWRNDDLHIQCSGLNGDTYKLKIRKTRRHMKKTQLKTKKNEQCKQSIKFVTAKRVNYHAFLACPKLGSSGLCM